MQGAGRGATAAGGGGRGSAGSPPAGQAMPHVSPTTAPPQQLSPGIIIPVSAPHTASAGSSHTPPSAASPSSSLQAPPTSSVRVAASGVAVPTFLPTSFFGSSLPKSAYLPFTTATKLFYLMDNICATEVDRIWKDQKFHIKIDFDVLLREDRMMAYFICNNSDSFAPYATSAARRFLLKKLKDINAAESRYTEVDLEKCLEEGTTVTIDGMPSSICRLHNFFSRSCVKMVDIHLVGRYQGKDLQRYILKGPELEEKGRIGLSNIVRYIIRNHKNRICWNGNWNIHNWEVINAKEVICTRPDGTTSEEWEWTAETKIYLNPSKPDDLRPYDRSSALNDLLAVVNNIMPMCYITEAEQDHNRQGGGSIPNVRYKPVFCQNFEDEIKGMAQLVQTPINPLRPTIPLSESKFDEWLETSVIHHPLLMNILARSSLELSWYYEFRKKNLADDPSWDAVLDDNFIWIKDFMEQDVNKRTHTVLDKVFWNNQKSRCNPRFGDTLGGAVTYHRMVVEHGTDHCSVTKMSVKNPKKKRLVTTMRDPKQELELLAAIKDENRLPRLIKMMFLKDKVK